MPRWQWIWTQLTRRLWLRATLIGALGILAALLAAAAERFIPWDLPGSISADAIDSILTIIASSMLAVTTFSLSVMTSAFSAATSNVTPRATKLLMEDTVSHNVLSTFIGAFLFGIVSIVVLKTGAYGERGRVVLFVMTIVVITLIVISLLRWIHHLTRLGRVGETTNLVEHATERALKQRLDNPYLGGQPLRDKNRDIPATATAVFASVVGYVQHIDMGILERHAEQWDADILIAAIPGTFLYPDTPLAWMTSPPGEDDADTWQQTIHSAFSIGDERSFDQDPRFGLAVMSEIASRALSPAINDPGTAIDVIGRIARLMVLWAQGGDEKTEDEVRHPHVHVPPLDTRDLFEDAFMLIARDGAGLIEIQLRLRKALLALGRQGDATFRAAALEQAQLALDRAESQLALESDKTRLRALEGGGV